MRNQQELPYLFLQGIVSFNQKLSSVLKRWATSCIGEALAAARACRELSTAIFYLISKQTDICSARAESMIAPGRSFAPTCTAQRSS